MLLLSRSVSGIIFWTHPVQLQIMMNQGQTPQQNPKTNNNKNRPEIRDDMDSRENTETGAEETGGKNKKEDTHPQGKKAGEMKDKDSGE